MPGFIDINGRLFDVDEREIKSQILIEEVQHEISEVLKKYGFTKRGSRTYLQDEMQINVEVIIKF